MIAALLVASTAFLALPARDAWTTAHVVDTPREWGVKRGGPQWKDGLAPPPACPPVHEGAHAMHAQKLGGDVICATEAAAQAPFTLQRVGAVAWSRALERRAVHVVALASSRLAVLLETKLLVVDAKTGAGVASIALPGYPSWAAADGDVVLVRMASELVAIDTAPREPVVLWRDMSDGERHDVGPLSRCGQWIDVAVRRDFRGEFSETRAYVVLRVIDPRHGVVGRKLVHSEKRFFDTVHFEPYCADSGRIHMVGRWIILD